jgi:hypothetical protein
LLAETAKHKRYLGDLRCRHIRQNLKAFGLIEGRVDDKKLGLKEREGILYPHQRPASAKVQ